ncbi:hypothetical protein [Cupriavidus sp. CP313]
MLRVAISRYIPVIACIATLAGCATFHNAEPFPKEQQQMTVDISKELPSTWSEMPTGVHVVPNTRLFVSGHQAGQGASILFGPLGVLVGSAINAERGKSLLGDDKALASHDLVSATEQLVKEGIAADGAGKLRYGPATPSTAQLTLMPFGVLSFINDTDVRPYVVVKTTLKDASGTQVWSTRYISASAEAKPFTGDNGWFKDDARPLKLAFEQSLKRSIDVMLRDVAGKTQRDTAKWTYVGGQYAFVKQPLKVKGNMVVDEPDYIAFTPRLGDVIVFTGVNIFDRKIVSITDATEQDPNMATFELPAPAAKDEAVKATDAPAAPTGAAATTAAVTTGSPNR